MVEFINLAMITKLEENAHDEETQKKIKKLKLYKVFMKCKAEEEAEREKENQESVDEAVLENQSEESHGNVRRDHCYLYIFKKK